MTDQRPSDALTKRPRPLRTGLLIGAVVVALSGTGVGAYAISQNTATPAAVVEETPTTEPNVEPTASFSFISTDGLTVTVDGSNSIDPDGELVSYGWEFGNSGTGTGATTSHTYGDYGTYTVTLTVTDDAGATGVFSADVTLNAPPPPPPPAPEPPSGGASSCPSGSFIAQGGEGVELLCMWDYCRNLTLPDPAHPECDSAWRP
jgi:PKD repeat protein